MGEQTLPIEENDWLALLSFLPRGWKEKARELGAFTRTRKFADPETLLRVLFMHIAEGHSLRTTSELAKLSGLAKVSDVAIMKRLAASNEWLQWMANEVKSKWFSCREYVEDSDHYRVRIVDGTTIQEPGATGTTWKIHYSINLSPLRCDEVLVSSPKTGEGLWNFKVNQNDLIIADRGFCSRRGIQYVSDNKGFFIVRVKHKMPFIRMDGSAINLLSLMKTLKLNDIGNWDAGIEINGEKTYGRICAIKKSKSASKKDKARIMKEAKKKGRKVFDSTLEASDYIIVFTNLPSSSSSAKILEFYRLRWQVELSFKRLKSILGLGHLKKFDETSAKAWLHGKLLVSFLIEALSSVGEVFFPWGYPIYAADAHAQKSMERNILSSFTSYKDNFPSFSD